MADMAGPESRLMPGARFGSAGAGFRGDMLDLVYRRVNRRDPRAASPAYAQREDRAALLLGRLGALLGKETGLMLRGLEATRAVLAAMAMELAYQRGMADGMRAGMGMVRRGMA